MKKKWNKPVCKTKSISVIRYQQVQEARERAKQDFTSEDIVFYDKLDFIINVLVHLRSELQVANRLSKGEKANIKMMYVIADQLDSD